MGREADGLPCELLPFVHAGLIRAELPDAVVERLSGQVDDAARRCGLGQAGISLSRVGSPGTEGVSVVLKDHMRQQRRHATPQRRNFSHKQKQPRRMSVRPGEVGCRPRQSFRGGLFHLRRPRSDQADGQLVSSGLCPTAPSLPPPPCGQWIPDPGRFFTLLHSLFLLLVPRPSRLPRGLCRLRSAPRPRSAARPRELAASHLRLCSAGHRVSGSGSSRGRDRESRGARP